MKCFEPFFTTKETGTGLGLAVCERAVRDHEGEFDVESALGLGTTIRMTLPTSRAGEDLGRDPMSLPDRSMQRVLYIDDAPQVREATAMILESSGYQVTLAKDGVTGLELLRSDQFDVVITDYGMPGMNGREVIALAKEIRPDIFAVLITGWPAEQLVASEQSPEDAVLEKPLKMKRFELALQQFRRTRSAT